MINAPLREAVSDCNSLIAVLEDLNENFRRKTPEGSFTRDEDLDFLRNAGRRALAGTPSDKDPGRIDAIKTELFKQPALRQKFEEHRESSADDKLDAFLNQQNEPKHTAADWARDREKLFAADMAALNLLPSHGFVLHLLFARAWPDNDRVKERLDWFCAMSHYSRRTIATILWELGDLQFYKHEKSNGGRHQFTAYTGIVKRAYERHEKRAKLAAPETVKPFHSNDRNCETISQLDGLTVKPFHTHSIKGSKAEPKAGARYARGPQEAASLRKEEGSIISTRVRDRVRLNDFVRSSKEVSREKANDIDEHAPTAQPRPRKTGPRRQFGDPAKWEPFFSRFYTDLSYGYPDQKKGLDSRFCYQRFHAELSKSDNMDFGADAIVNSVARFKKMLAKTGKPFPGENAALSDVKKWLKRELKGTSRIEPDKDELEIDETDDVSPRDEIKMELATLSAKQLRDRLEYCQRQQQTIAVGDTDERFWLSMQTEVILEVLEERIA